MARTLAELPKGTRITDHISLGVIAKAFPAQVIEDILRRTVLRSKTPDLVKQEFYGLLLAHHAIRGLMHEAALKAGVDPDELSLVHAVRVVRRKMPLYAALPPSASGGLP